MSRHRVKNLHQDSCQGTSRLPKRDAPDLLPLVLSLPLPLLPLVLLPLVLLLSASTYHLS